MTASASLSETSAHIRVIWGNAIGPGELSCCYDDPATALRDAWTAALERWNNTNVTIWWHPSHAGTRRREAEYADHPAGRWSCACGIRCALPERFQAEEDAEITAAVTAAGITPMPRPGRGGRLLARLPGSRAAGPEWQPGPAALAGPRRGAILAVARHVDVPLITSFTAALGSELGGAVVVQPRSRAAQPGGRVPDAEFPEASPLAAPRQAAGARASRPRPVVGGDAARPGKTPGA